MKRPFLIIFILLLAVSITHAKTCAKQGVYIPPSGDTLEYKASKYVIQPNNKLVDILIQIPDVVVSKDDRILSQGETVKKLLVDGSEYFGDTPSVALHSIRADTVDKIQIYYVVNDQATFNDIDEMRRIKTINVVLKKDKK